MARDLRVAAIQAQARRMVEDYDAGQPLSGKPVLVATIRDLLTALAAVEQARDRYRALYEAELDTHYPDEQRLARLAALEQAARALRADLQRSSDPMAVHAWVSFGAMGAALDDLDDPEHALDPPPPEQP